MRWRLEVPWVLFRTAKTSRRMTAPTRHAGHAKGSLSALFRGAFLCSRSYWASRKVQINLRDCGVQSSSSIRHWLALQNGPDLTGVDTLVCQRANIVLDTFQLVCTTNETGSPVVKKSWTPPSKPRTCRSLVTVQSAVVGGRRTWAMYQLHHCCLNLLNCS